MEPRLSDERLLELELKWLSGTITQNEKEEYAAWYNSYNDDNLPLRVPKQIATNKEQHKDKILRKIDQHIGRLPDVAPRMHRLQFLKTGWLRYAAAIILIIGAAVLYSLIAGQWPIASSNNKQRTAARADIAPGTNRAILTIGNNQPIELASDKTGVTIGNDIKYNDGSSIQGLAINDQLSTINSITTPRGGQYHALLPDGTKVWLNAASSVKFPSKFNGNQREVEITGEVYLEIAKNAKQPFLVHTNKETIQVLGTNFNINAYKDEATEKTTLIEGSVKILLTANPRLSTILTPGQQCMVADGHLSAATNADIDEVLAWKNGLFNFNGADLPTVMRQLERWYNIKTVYKGKVEKRKFWGKLSRDLNLSEVLDILKDMKVNFRMEGKTLVVEN